MLPLFPLDIVLLPGELVPLHIFEERYRRMVAECRRTGGPFGIVLHREAAMASTGCAATIVAVLDEFPDGRLNIVVRGGDRFRVVEVEEPEDPEAEPLRASVSYREEVEGYVPTALLEEVRGLFARVLSLAESEEPPPTSDELPLSYVVGGMLELDLALKQRLLQLDEETERLQVVRGAMRALIPRLEVWRSREQAIRGNGKGI